jgi:hypothetical protein
MNNIDGMGIDKLFFVDQRMVLEFNYHVLSAKRFPVGESTGYSY